MGLFLIYHLTITNVDKSGFFEEQKIYLAG